MGEKALEVFQGDDWLTYRWSVAQLFDTLDRLRDLCQNAPVFGVTPPLAPNAPMQRFDLPGDDETDVYVCVAELCDDLSGELDAVEADLFPQLQKETAHRWMGFEMRLHVNEMRRLALIERETCRNSAAALDSVLALCARIRDLLRQIDQ